VGVFPQNALVKWIGFPPPAALRAPTSPASGRGKQSQIQAWLKLRITFRRLSRHAGENDRRFCRNPKIPRRFKRTSDVWIFRAAIEGNQLHAMRALHLIAFTESLRSLGERLFALGTQNLDPVSHEISRQFWSAKATPIRFSLRQTMWQFWRSWRLTMFSVISCGIPTGLATSSAAPIGDILRIVQSTLPPWNSMVPAFKTRCRGFARRSSMLPLLQPKSKNRVNGDRKIGQRQITNW
jgi:hypothetical protein